MHMTGRGSIHLATALVATLVLHGCLDGDRAESIARAPIVGGQPTQNPAVVRLVGSGTCMGTLVAPNVVLTAKHCVTTFEGGGPFECDEDGELYVDPDAPVVYVGAGEFDEVLPAETFSIGDSSAYASRVVEIHVSAGETICESDTALLVLDRPVDDLAIAPLRLEDLVEVGESLTAVGNGQHEGGDQSQQLLGRLVTVAAIGPEPAVPGVTDALSPGFFSTTEGPCRGDSGSAAFASTGAAVGVASTVGRPDLDMPTGTFEDCVGSRARYDATATRATFIEETLATVGATPWREGEPDPRAGLSLFDEPCDDDADCRSGVCVSHDDGETRCSQGCLSSACPDEYECRDVDQRMRCVWVPPAEPVEPARSAGDEGCAMVAPRPGGPWWVSAACSILCLGLLVSRRRGRAPLGEPRQTGDGRPVRSGVSCASPCSSSCATP
jgi:hypothetical protein